MQRLEVSGAVRLIYRSLGVEGIVGWVEPRAGLDGRGKPCPQTGLDPRAVQPVASHYTD